jgi:hypothetical protein
MTLYDKLELTISLTAKSIAWSRLKAKPSSVVWVFLLGGESRGEEHNEPVLGRFSTENVAASRLTILLCSFLR